MNIMPYNLVVEMGSIFLRCFYHSYVVKKNTKDSWYHNGKSYANYYILSKFGYMRTISIFDKETKYKNWANIGGLTIRENDYDYDLIYQIKRQLLKDVLEDIKLGFGLGKPSHSLANDIVKKLKLKVAFED